MAIFTSLFDLAVLTAAPAVGVMIDVKGYTTAFAGLGTFIGAGLLVYLLWDRAVHPNGQTGSPAVSAEITQ